MSSEKPKKRCKIFFAEWDEITPDVIDNLEKTLKHFDLTTYRLEHGGSFLALAVCTKDITKQEAEKEYLKHVK